MDPSPNSIKTRHHGTDHFLLCMSDEEQLWLDGALPPDHFCRCIPGAVAREDLLPKRDHGRVIPIEKWPDFEVRLTHI